MQRMLVDFDRVVVSGHEVSVQIALVNSEGEVARDDSRTVGELSFVEAPEYGMLKDNQVIAKEGVLNFTSMYIQMPPGTSTLLQLTVIDLDPYGNLLEFLLEPVKIPIYARPCVLGEMLTEERTCVPCDPGTYSVLTNITEPSVCKPCPQHAICLGGSDMTPQQGFSRVDV